MKKDASSICSVVQIRDTMNAVSWLGVMIAEQWRICARSREQAG
jgi:hypothetical protein